MNPASVAPAPFFLEGSIGRLFCLDFMPAKGRSNQTGVLLVPPFAEELNKSRRMLALQARLFAERGLEVLFVDLYGTGDSEGTLADASWSIWQSDLLEGVSELRRRGCEELWLWGVRMGSLLAVQLADQVEELRRLIMWQPVPVGQVFLTQFIRLRMAASLMGSGTRETVKSLREELDQKGRLEVAGYELNQDIARGLEESTLADARLPAGLRVDWIEISSHGASEASPSSRKVTERWHQSGVDVCQVLVQGDPFWATQEITVVQGVLDATMGCLE